MKRVKGMKKYSHLFLFVVLLNATSFAQTTQPSNQGTAESRGLSRTGIAALQSLGRAATTLALMTADIAVPVAPLYLPAPPAIGAPAIEAAPIQVVDRMDASATGAAIASAPISGRGFRNSVNKRLRGQTTGNARIDEIICVAATRHGVEPLLLYSVMHQESAFNSQAVSPKGA